MIKNAFVTGATGFLGKHLLNELDAQGWQITAIHRNILPQELTQMAVNWVQASLDDVVALQNAMPAEPFVIFHLAADTTQWKPNYPRQTRTNVDGTRNVLEAARNNRVQRMIHVSSIAAFGPHDTVINEKTPSIALQSGRNYAVTKWQAEEMVRNAVANGDIEAVIINPCHILGPGDTQNWIQIFKAVKEDKLPGIPPAWGNFGYVTEMAKAMVTAADKGQIGENYLLGGPHVAFLHVIQEAQRQLGKPVSKKASPPWLFKLVEPAMRLASMVTGKEPQLTPDKVKLIIHKLNVDDTKARTALNYKHLSLEEMVSRTLAWMQEND